MNKVDKQLVLYFIGNTVLQLLTTYTASAKIKIFINVVKPLKKPVKVFMY